MHKITLVLSVPSDIPRDVLQEIVDDATDALQDVAHVADIYIETTEEGT